MKITSKKARINTIRMIFVVFITSFLKMATRANFAIMARKDETAQTDCVKYFV
jgi:hypothetical protein